MNLKHRDFLGLKDFNKAELESLLDLAAKMKAGKINEKYLQDKHLGMLFTVASTRTRISFQVGTRQLGGHAEYYNSSDLQLSNHESLKDTASVMSRLLDAIIVRMYDMNFYGQGHDSIKNIADHADVPVINALDDKEHPCQVMADLLTLREKYGDDYKRKRVVMSWGYSKRQKSLGVLHSMMVAGSMLGMNLIFAHPKDYELDEEYLSFAKNQIKESGGTLEFTNDLMEASEGADVIYVKNWKSLKMSKDEEDAYKQDIKADWCVSGEHYKRANPGAFYMDCMPFIRGEQVTAEVADGENSIIYDQAENRLHAQKAIMASLI
ncbi:MAG TPA: ornithine carbamoyltransferase [Pyrinomonadaceae bacterium]|jgi:ornithine carbamoyltransferase